MTTPYWSSPDGNLTLYHGKFEDVLPALGLQPDLLVVDPPYGETGLAWDRWPDGWPGFLAEHTTARAMWCFGSMRMFLNHAAEFADWTLSQDIVWEKHNGSGFQNDRFKRVHEHVVLWYRGSWGDQCRDVPRIPAADPSDLRPRKARGPNVAPHMGSICDQGFMRDGTRLMRSVIKVPSMKGRAIHETEKPVPLLDPLIRYSCPPGGLVLDPMAGSGSTLDAARQAGRRAIGIEGREKYADAAATRLANQFSLEFS